MTIAISLNSFVCLIQLIYYKASSLPIGTYLPQRGLSIGRSAEYYLLFLKTAINLIDLIA